MVSLPHRVHGVRRLGRGEQRFVGGRASLSTFTHAKGIGAWPSPSGLLRQASEKITDSMLATFAASGEGSGKQEIVDRLRSEETGRGLQFEYCLITIGSSHNRAISDQAWKRGDFKNNN